MKKLLIALGLGVLLMGTSALANENNGAIVIKEDGTGSCYYKMWLLDDEPYPDAWNFWIGGDVHVVQNKNMIKTICNLDVPEWAPTTETAMKDRGFSCGVLTTGYGWILASDSKFVYTPGGEARLECSYKVNK